MQWMQCLYQYHNAVSWLRIEAYCKLKAYPQQGMITAEGFLHDSVKTDRQDGTDVVPRCCFLKRSHRYRVMVLTQSMQELSTLRLTSSTQMNADEPERRKTKDNS